jgi:hypothetical protein
MRERYRGKDKSTEHGIENEVRAEPMKFRRARNRKLNSGAVRFSSTWMKARGLGAAAAAVAR